MEHEGKECYARCSSREGPCNTLWCGLEGACCRAGVSDAHPSCAGDGCAGEHCCVPDARKLLPLKHEGKQCYARCSSREGPCNTLWCGLEGACCRRGVSDSDPSCAGHGCAGEHCCVADARNLLRLYPLPPPPRSPPPSPAPPSPPSLEHPGEECYGRCSNRDGPCGTGFCGSGGACCRAGWSDSNAGCAGEGCSDRHCCVADARKPPPPPSSPQPASPPSPPSLEHPGEECYGRCNKRDGPCGTGFCGTEGVCCREGQSDRHPGCAGNGCAHMHCCVADARKPPAPPASPPRAAAQLLIDTDMSIDVDDVGMLCAAHALVQRGEAAIVGVVHSTGLPAGVGAIYAINEWWGRPDIPVGGYHGPVGSPEHPEAYPPWVRSGRGVYVDSLVDSFQPSHGDFSSVPSGLEVYRDALSSAADGSVDVVAVGHCTVLLELLSLNGGPELLAAKVRRLVLMGGRHVTHLNDPPEWNVAGCGGGACGGYGQLASITNQTLELWPKEVPVVFVPFETGVTVRSGAGLARRNFESSPCDVAYHAWRKAEYWPYAARDDWHGRSSWDPIALLYAVRGDPGGRYDVVRGRMSIDGGSGKSEWLEEEGETGQVELLLAR